MRWVRRASVVVLLAAPVLVVVVVAWPDDRSGGGGAPREEGSGPGGALVAGDAVGGEVGFGEVAEYRLIGDDGDVRVGVRGAPGFDATVTVVDADGDQVAYNDDSNGLDPEVGVELTGEELVVEVRELSGNAGGFTVYVDR